ncbi:hypothetical protein FEM48_Zijuj01G0157400 [Ziziphus jujuba var. spinosa]|uniref:SNF2 N-terminal domain-containing protein n=1 Tax=Ziziphus jujuba var. spinosa TaxID=714518 RepID=A0A978W245_ZIZJJ|nr:hypothetical protein FEM48_Zijuj01G0157400 [Ziziphus jujuba var. spinosa]
MGLDDRIQAQVEVRKYQDEVAALNVKLKEIVTKLSNVLIENAKLNLTVVVDAFRRIPKATWNAKERLWIFPASYIVVGGETTKYLVLKFRIPTSMESKLLPFQREGVRFILQHGGRALLADEMGLGKTLKAIAVASCIHDSWPVLIMTPSSLRLQWASMIEQWLDIPPYDILVILVTCLFSRIIYRFL